MSIAVVEGFQGVDGTVLYTAVDEAGVPIPGASVAIVALTHGNEPVGEGVLIKLAEVVATQLKAGSVLAVRANRGAGPGRRCTEDGVDLNRLYDRTTQQTLSRMPPESLCYEERRALELAPLLQRCDALLDLHSTSRPSEPFLLFRDDQRHAAMALKLGVTNMVTGMHESPILEGGLCSNVGLNPGEASDRLGFTFEAGQHVDPGNMERAWQVTLRLLFELGVWRERPPTEVVVPEIYEILDRFQQAPSGSPRWTFVDPANASFNRRNPRELKSFEFVQADEKLVARGSAVVRANTPFTMLMPAPDAEAGSDLFFYAQRRYGGLSAGVSRTDGEAQREAFAIERMMDLLADDDMEEGVSWIAFDSRRCLDLCAELIGRTMRMPKGDPHRRLSVVGRGDWGGGDSERRAGQRYRQVMRDAIQQGVPIERLQVMRGASLGWLDALTSDTMVSLLAERGGESIRLFLSAHQPHTVSVLVCGDLALALATGDTRKCRVAILVEAATVEPDEDTARVSVVRTAMVGARPELLRAAQKVVESIKLEHRRLVQDHPLLAKRSELLGPNGEMVANADAMETLRGVVLRLQLNTWLESLRPELPRPMQLPNSRAMGRWLASIMSRSGILDVDALRHLLIRPHGLGWQADISALENLLATGTDADLRALVGPERPPSPRQPVVADDVNADNLERWIGWKRYVRGHDVVPADRGKDLDLVFTESRVRSRVTGLLYEACARAADKAGDVMVVMAGDGLDPESASRGASDLHAAHRRVLLDPKVRYLRIQHAQGTHLSWMKDVVSTIQARPPDGAPVSLLFEAEHGATVNVVMVLERAGATDEWSLEGWRIESAAVVISHLPGLNEGGPQDTKVALFTERLGHSGTINQELLHFCRAHCGGLLKQVGWRASAEHGRAAATSIEHAFQHHLERYVERVRSLAHGVDAAPEESHRRREWVSRQLGIADHRLAERLAGTLDSTATPADVAQGLWTEAPVWPIATAVPAPPRR